MKKHNNLYQHILQWIKPLPFTAPVITSKFQANFSPDYETHRQLEGLQVWANKLEHSIKGVTIKIIRSFKYVLLCIPLHFSFQINESDLFMTQSQV